jgi:hypothetical protein
MLLTVPLSLLVGGTVLQVAGSNPRFSCSPKPVEGEGHETLMVES